VVDFYRETRSRPGCIGVRVVRRADEDTEFALVEQWDDRADQEARRIYGVYCSPCRFADADALAVSPQPRSQTVNT